MALSIDKLKNPKVLAIGAVFVVVGIYVSSRINSKRKADAVPPTEITPRIVSVVGADTLQTNDENTRKLGEAQDRYNALEQQQQEALSGYQDSLKSTVQSERDRAAIDIMQRGTAFDAQLKSLNAYIVQLETAAANVLKSPVVSEPTVPATGTGYTIPVFPTPILPTAPVTTAPVIGNQGTLYYPGLANNYRMDCSSVEKREFVGRSYDTWVADFRSKGINNTMVQRQLAQTAIGGWPHMQAIRGGELKDGRLPATNPIVVKNRIWINKQRVVAGVQPLANYQFDQMADHMLSLWNGDERNNVFASGAYARELYARWNAPFQCSASARRF